MIEHIVKNNEQLNDILNMYHISIEELREHNSHITDFNHLISGTKLMIPLVSEEVEQILEKTEGFVMDYYPKITEDIIPSLDKKFETVKEKPLEKKEEISIKNETILNSPENNPRTPYPGIVPPKNPYKGR